MKQVTILYDGRCNLCQHSIRWCKRFDWLQHLSPVDYHNEKKREEVAPGLFFEDLNRAMHVRLLNGKTLKGFQGIRALCWHLPLFVLVTPLLYLPGISHFGDFMYKQIADNRKKCTHEACSM
jgi:predicted DCC family thiol-disulfide oxidoreductase YuxK